MVSEQSGRRSMDWVEWAKALVAEPLTGAMVVDLLELLRNGPDDAVRMAAWALGVGEIPGHLSSDTIRSLMEVVGEATRAEVVRGQAAETVADLLDLCAPTPLRRVAEMQLTAMLGDASPVVRFGVHSGSGGCEWVRQCLRFAS